MIAVVYLVWGQFGVGPVRRFLSSYEANPAGVDHELVFLFNGVTNESDRRAIEEEISRVAHREITLLESALDIAAYRQVADQLTSEFICFLNSYCEILVPNWLVGMTNAASQPDIGLTGATGTWSSSRSWIWNSIGLPGAYRSVLPGRAERRALMQAAEHELAAERVTRSDDKVQLLEKTPSTHRAVRDVITRLQSIPVELRRTPGFPNPFIRTNAFVVRTDRFLQLKVPPITRKEDTYGMEGGRLSLTRQIYQMGLRAVVVDTSGETYDSATWPDSNTFWQRHQQGLLISDNQTRLYERGGLDRRRLLSGIAWGKASRPADSSPTDNQPSE